MYKTPRKKSVKILGQLIPIRINDAYCVKQGADGLYDGGKIYLRSTYHNEKEYLLVFRHECIHALCEALGVQLDTNVEEVLAHRISYMLSYEI